MANKVHFNIKNVHYAVKTDEGYSAPVAIPGAVSLSTDANGDQSIFWADGIKYWMSYNNAGYEGDLEIAMLPDTFRIDVLGDVKDQNEVLVENANAVPKEFALGFTIDGDMGPIYFWYYVCTASRPSQEANTTEESKEPDTESLEWSCSANADGVVRAKSTDTTSQAILDAWFTQVYVPSTNGTSGTGGTGNNG